jgi:hypothetical protein
MSINKKLVVGASVACMVVGATWGTIAMASGEASSVDRSDAVGLTSHTDALWSTRSEITVPAVNLARLGESARGFGDGDTLRPDTGRRVAFAGGRSIDVAATEDGALCWSADNPSLPSDESVGCGHGLGDFGLGIEYTPTPGLPGTDIPVTLKGIAASDVTSLTINTGDGKVVAVPVSNGAFYWVGAPNQTVVKATVVRGGETYVITELFD